MKKLMSVFLLVLIIITSFSFQHAHSNDFSEKGHPRGFTVISISKCDSVFFGSSTMR